MKLRLRREPEIEKVGDLRELLSESDAIAVATENEEIRDAVEIARLLRFVGDRACDPEIGLVRWMLRSESGEKVRVEERKVVEEKAADDLLATKLWIVSPVEFDLPSGTVREATAFRVGVFSLAEREFRATVREYGSGEKRDGSSLRFLSVRNGKERSDRDLYWSDAPSVTLPASLDPPSPPEPIDEEARLVSIGRFLLDVAREVVRRKREDAKELEIDLAVLRSAREELFGKDGER